MPAFVLNLPVTNCREKMTRIGIFFLIILFLAAVAARPVSAQVGLVIESPRQADVLQGVVTIRGSSDIAGFVSAELDFAFAEDTTGTWFQIAMSNTAVNLGTLATWDTTTITDGNYVVRLRVMLKDGSFHDIQVSNLRVRNYTPVETPTPAPTPLHETPIPSPTQTATPFPSPTPLKPNPAILTPVDVSNSVAYGGLGAVLFLVILSIYLGLRRR
jgi:hypothetical protein